MVSIDMKKIVCIQILLWMSCLINVSAQDSYKEYEQKVYVSSQGDSLQYCLLRPEVEKPGEKYPLVLFLHGAGERGNDNRKQLKHGGKCGLILSIEKVSGFYFVTSMSCRKLLGV